MQHVQWRQCQWTPSCNYNPCYVMARRRVASAMHAKPIMIAFLASSDMTLQAIMTARAAISPVNAQSQRAMTLVGESDCAELQPHMLVLSITLASDPVLAPRTAMPSPVAMPEIW